MRAAIPFRGSVQTQSPRPAPSRLPADVRPGGKELRCADRCHTGPLALSPGTGGPGNEQAHLLRQANYAHGRRGEKDQGGVSCLRGHLQGEHPGFKRGCTTISIITDIGGLGGISARATWVTWPVIPCISSTTNSTWGHPIGWLPMPLNHFRCTNLNWWISCYSGNAS